MLPFGFREMLGKLLQREILDEGQRVEGMNGSQDGSKAREAAKSSSI